jgi:hypothetical protein
LARCGEDRSWKWAWRGSGVIGWWYFRFVQRRNRNIGFNSGGRLGRNKPRWGGLTNNRRRNSGSGNASVAVNGRSTKARVDKVGGRHFIAITIEYLNGVVGAARPNAINERSFIAFDGR